MASDQTWDEFVVGLRVPPPSLPTVLTARPDISTATAAVAPAPATAGSLPSLQAQVLQPALATAPSTPQLPVARAVAFALPPSSSSRPEAACRSPSVDSSATVYSGDTGCSVHFHGDESVDLIEEQTARRAASKDPDLVAQKFKAPSTVGSATTSSGMGRTPWSPHSERTDVGWLSLYQGNWGGKRTNKVLSEHITNDAIKRNPCHFLVAQEVDEDTCTLMETMSNPEGRPPADAPANVGSASVAASSSSSASTPLSCRDCGKTDVARGSRPGGGEDYCDCCSVDVR